MSCLPLLRVAFVLGSKHALLRPRPPPLVASLQSQPSPSAAALAASTPTARPSPTSSSLGSLCLLSMSSRGAGRRGGGGGNRRRGGGGGRRRSRTPPPPMPPPGQPGRGCYRDLTVGADVYAVKKDDQRTGRETRGAVSRLLTNSSYHPRGIKVMLTSGEVGRVTRLVADGMDSGSGGGIEQQEEERPPPPPPSFSTFVAASASPAETEKAPSIDIVGVDDGALAMLVGEMDFDSERAREALEMFDNDVERTVDYLLREHGG